MANKRKGYKHGDFIKGDPNPHVDTYKYKDRQTGKITSHKVEGSEMKSSQKKQQARQGQLAGRKSKPKIMFYLKDPEKSKPKLIIKDPKPKQEPKYPRNGKQREGGLDSSDITENLQQGKPDPILPPKEKGIRKALRGGGRAYGKKFVMKNLKDQLAGIAALVAAVVAIGGGFATYGKLTEKINVLESKSSADYSAQIAVLEEKVAALQNADTSHEHDNEHGHTKILVNEKEIELLQVQIEEIKVSTSNPLAN